MHLLFLAPLQAAALDSEQLAVGIAEDGSFCDAEAVLGLLHDPDGPGGDPVGTDLLTPGRCFETWALQTAAETIVQNEGDTGGTALTWEVQDTGSVMTWAGEGTLAGVDVVLWIDLPYDRPVILMTYQLTATEDVEDVWLSRTVDPDTDFLFSDSYSTANGASDEVAWAASAQVDKALALATPGGQGGICSWCSTPSQVSYGTVGELEGDYVVGVATHIGDLAEGESVEVVIAYGFGPSGTEAAELALDESVAADIDGDGVPGEADCDDRDAASTPGAEDVANGWDDDCDGEVDEDAASSDGGDGSFTSPTDDLRVVHVEEPVGGCGAVSAGPWLLGLLLLRRRR